MGGGMGGGLGGTSGNFGGGANGGGTSSGAFGQRSIGSGAGLSGGTNGFGGPVAGNNFGTGRGAGFSNIGGVGTQGGRFQTQAFAGMDPNSLGSFVGALNQAQTQGGAGGMYGGNAFGGNTGLNQFGQNNRGGRQGQNFGGGQGNNSGRASIVRVNYSVDFNHPAEAPSKLTQNLARSFRNRAASLRLGRLLCKWKVRRLSYGGLLPLTTIGI